MKKLGIILFVWMKLISHTEAKEVDEKLNFDELLTIIYNNCSEEVPYEILQEHLWKRYQDPLELNRASAKALQQLCILTEEQIDQFFRHLDKNGPLISIYELQAIPDFDLITIQRLVPFVKVEEVSTDSHNRTLWERRLGIRDHYGLVRYERSPVLTQDYLPDKKRAPTSYIGSPDGFLTQLSIKQPSGWGLGWAARKKAGESLAWDPDTQRYGLPIMRFYGTLDNKKNLKKLVVGDYEVGYGQSLVLHAGFSQNKGSEVIKIVRTNNLGIRPHMSLSNAAFRGIATTFHWRFAELTAYYSTIDLDGKLERNHSLEEPYVKSLSRGGYYRTESEIEKKGQVNEQVIGSTLVCTSSTKKAKIGVNVLYSHYNYPIKPDIRTGNPLRFSGQDHANGSLFYGYPWQNFYFFGEGALSKNGGRAAVVGTVASLSRYLDATVLWRHYDQDFHAPFGKGFKENTSENSNEQGIYLGTRITFWKRLYVDAYFDYFYLPWFLGQESTGYSWLSQATYQPSKTSLVCLQYRTKTKAKKIPKEKKIAMGTKDKYKLLYKYTFNKATSLKSEVQCSSYQQLDDPKWGYAATQDITYKIRKFRIKGRVAWFSMEAWENRLNFYEPNVSNSGSNFPAYYGQGMRYCCLLCYKPTPFLRLEVKYGLTHYLDQTLESPDNTAGCVADEVRLQAILKF